jgi:hypothetical protein
MELLTYIQYIERTHKTPYCPDCVYFIPVQDDLHGECVKKAPAPIFSMDAHEKTYFIIRPSVDCGETCGEGCFEIK